MLGGVGEGPEEAEEEEKRLRWLFSEEGREGEDGCGATATELAARFQSRGALAQAVAVAQWGWRPFQRRAAQPPQPPAQVGSWPRGEGE